MVGFTLQTSIQESPSRVFEVFADLAGAEERLSQVTRIELLTDGSVGEGTRFRETRTVLGNELTDEMTITHFHAPESYRVEGAALGTEYMLEFRFEPESGGTLVTTRCECRPTNVVTSLLMPFAQAIVDRVEDHARTDLDDFKTWLEREDPKRAQTGG